MLKQHGSKSQDGLWHTPAADRNKQPILEVLQRLLPDSGLVLEIGSGTGQHIVHFAPALSHLEWQPSEADSEFQKSVALHLEATPCANVRRPIRLDVHEQWPAIDVVAVISINMIHVAPWSATQALCEGAAGVLDPGGILFLYGPYSRDGAYTSDGNAAFDRQLQARDPKWGIRDLEAVTDQAKAAGFSFVEVVEMPANNLSVVFRRD